MNWERHFYRTIDDLHNLVDCAAKLPSVIEIRILAGVVEVRHRSDQHPDLETVRLPSDDLVEKARAGVDWKIVYRGDIRSAFLEGIGVLHQEGIHATHVASRSAPEFLKEMNMFNSTNDPGLTRWLAGIELVEHSYLEPGIYLLCGGNRVHGSISDITTIVRLEKES